MNNRRNFQKMTRPGFMAAICLLGGIILALLILGGCAGAPPHQQSPVAEQSPQQNWAAPAAPLPPATQWQERSIYMGCAHQTELGFYIAQEKLYNSGNADRLMVYLHRNLPDTQYRIVRSWMMRIATWVDRHDFKTAKDYARHFFYECVGNSYQSLQAASTPGSQLYIKRFEKVLDGVEEHMLPSELGGPKIGA